VGLLVGALLLVVVATVGGLRAGPAVREWGPLAQTVESTINDLVFVGIAVVFLLGLERRLQRRRELRAIFELRSIAHIVDMHQLTKDPDRLRLGLPDTASSPDRPLGPVELARYLDYCSELLSLTGKIAAIYGEGTDDPVVLGAVQQVEGLATGLSQKIWQKIMILDAATAPHR
jgi:energy-converting hydrogenase Eha subunit E